MTPADLDFSTPNNAAESLRMLAELVRQEKATCTGWNGSGTSLALEFVIPKDRKRP